MTHPTVVPELREISSYMLGTGWLECPPGHAGSVWVRDDDAIGVPHSNRSDSRSILGVLERLADADRVSIPEMSNRIRYFRIDVARMRAANTYQISDSIPLRAAATIVNESHRMYRSVGTTARGERSEIGSNWSTRGDKVVQDARVGHTEQGSYVIPILVRLPRLKPTHDSLLEDKVVPFEPFERRVTRTFAVSMAAVEKVIIEPAKDPTVDQLMAVVERGVSSEFCDALAKVLAEESVAEFSASFDWAPAVKISKSIPTEVAIDADARPLVAKTAERLKIHRIEPSRIFSGLIVGLHHETGHGFGDVTLATVKSGRPAKIRVRLDYDLYRDAVLWHKDARPVLVEGRVDRDRSRRWFVDSPMRCNPVDELPLDVD